jgi:PAS domain S-box-containing protein
MRTERALQDAERFNRTVLSSVDEGIVVYDREFRYLLWNRYMEELSGFPAEEVLGKCAFDLFPHLREQGIDKILRRALAGETVRSPDTQYWIPGTDRRGWAVGLYGPHVNAAGEIVGVVEIVRDITPRKLTERELQDREQLFRCTFEQSPVGTAIVALNGRILRFNEKLRRIGRWGPDDLLSFPDLFHPEDALVLQENLNALALGGAEDVECEARMVGKDGVESWVKLSVRLVRDAEGRPLHFLPMVEDISERKNAVEALKKSERELALRNRISDVFLSLPDELAQGEVLRVFLEAGGSRQGVFGIIDEDDALVCPSCSPGIEEDRDPGTCASFPQGLWTDLWGRSLTERRPLYGNDGFRLPAIADPFSRGICIPLVRGEALLGLIALADREADFGDRDIEVLQGLAAHVATILHARLERDRQREARRQAESALALLRKKVSSGNSFAGIVGRSRKMAELFETIREVTDVDLPVLIQGESGTGKELVAAAIHKEGPRAQRPFIPVNCSALPENLLESELFGHVRGAFTGAVRDKKGRFELADGGTIFLDEVGDLTPPIQVSLLRVLQEKTIERVGGEGVQQVDVRVISATHKDLRRLVEQGKFREDLFYRLCVLPISVPPLRDRIEDLSLLADAILNQLRLRGQERHVLSPEALEILKQHRWPGNVRELQNAIGFACVKCRGPVIEACHLPPSISRSATESAKPRLGRRPKLTPAAVLKTLEENGGNRMEAARTLGVTRATIYKYIERSKDLVNRSTSALRTGSLLLALLGLAACRTGERADPTEMPGPPPPAFDSDMAGGSLQTAPPDTAAIGDSGSTAPSPIEERWGIRIASLRRTAGGYMLDFRFRVVDPEKAKPLFDRAVKPYLVDQATGARMVVPSPPKAGPLRTTNPPQAEKSYFVLFANPGGQVRPGGKVTVVIGDFRAEDLTVQ